MEQLGKALSDRLDVEILIEIEKLKDPRPEIEKNYTCHPNNTHSLV